MRKDPEFAPQPGHTLNKAKFSILVDPFKQTGVEGGGRQVTVSY